MQPVRPNLHVAARNTKEKTFPQSIPGSLYAHQTSREKATVYAFIKITYERALR